MKVHVSSMAWLDKNELGQDGVGYLKDALTIVPRKARGYGDDEQPSPINCWVESQGFFGVPRGYFFDTAKDGHEIVWAYSEGEPMRDIECHLQQTGKYAEQATAIEAMAEWFGCHDDSRVGPLDSGRHLGAILQGSTGFGKTNTALAFLHRLGRASLIIVHKEFLFRQWEKRIREFLPQANIGFVREDACGFEGCDFILAMAQSLALEDGKRYPRELYSYPGVVVVDEVHRVGAKTWSPIPSMFESKYRLGLTATPRRKDGADKVFWWSIGDIVYTAETETPKPMVRAVEGGGGGPDILYNEGVSPSVVVNILTKLDHRNGVIVDEVIKALKAPSGRKIMVISERLEQLARLEKAIKEVRPDVTTDFYVGEWFTGEKSFSMLNRKKLDDEKRPLAVDAIYRHFRRRRFGQWETEKAAAAAGKKPPRKVDKSAWSCAVKVDGKHYVALYQHGYRPVCLEDTGDKGLCALARDYGIAQSRAKPKLKKRTEEELEQAERARIIFASYQMCAEGVDIPALDTQVMASPVSDPEQAVGRIRRWCTPEREGGQKKPEQCQHYCPWRAESCRGKPDPVVADVGDRRIPLAKKRRRYRMEFYESIGTRVSGH